MIRKEGDLLNASFCWLVSGTGDETACETASETGDQDGVRMGRRGGEVVMGE